MSFGNNKQDEFQECMEQLKKYACTKPRDKAFVDSLKERLYEADTPKLIFALLLNVLDLTGRIVPIIGPIVSITSLGLKGLLLLYKILSKKSSKIKVIEKEIYIDIDLQRKAIAVQSALTSSLHFLRAIETRTLNDHEIQIVQGQVPQDIGTKFLAELEYKIKALQENFKGRKPSETGDETGKSTDEENRKKGEKTEEEETIQRCNAIIALIDLYCVLSRLREFVMYYLVTVFANNGVPKEIQESYLERRELFQKNRQAVLKVLHEPEEIGASVAAVFISNDWPKLRSQIDPCPDLNNLTDRPQYIVSAADETFAMFRYDPNKNYLFTLTKYVRVFANIKTKFVFRAEGYQDFTIRLCENDDFVWKISDDQGALLECSRTTRDKQCDKFNVVRLSNGNVMFSSKKRPTCFVRMETAKNDARLGVANNGFDETCQWKLIR